MDFLSCIIAENSMKTSFTRRNFLRAGGIAIALPSLESFAQPAKSLKETGEAHDLPFQ